MEENKVDNSNITQENSTNAPVDMGFGINTELEASNKIPFKAGLQQGYLIGVKAYNKISKKGEAYDALEFNFVDLKNEASFDKIEFAVDRAKDVNAKNVRGGKELAMNVRIKHIYEAYAPFPAAGLGYGATSWLDYFQKIAKAFNENGKDNTPIFKEEGKFIQMHLKFTYFNNNLGFPYSPNFIERVKEGKATNLVIDLNYDVVVQVAKTAGSAKAPHEQNNPVFGGTTNPNAEFEQFMG